MGRAVLLLLAATGCRGLLGIDGATETDGGSGGDGVDGCASWHPAGFDPCALGQPMPTLHIPSGSGRKFNTTTGVLTDPVGTKLLTSTVTIKQSDQSEVSVLFVQGVVIEEASSFTITGTRPFLLVSFSTMNIDGTLDGGSTMSSINDGAHTSQVVLGPAANVGCTSALTGQAGQDAVTTPGSGGGGGGAFQGSGGLGGSNNAGSAPQGGSGGLSGTEPPIVHGGCPGGTSGSAGSSATQPANANSHAIGGGGGGALWLAARDTIVVGSGIVSAGGGGGAGAPTNSSCGGGGGGSGGMILIDAPTVRIMGTLAANGGGGGGGGDTANAGKDGGDGSHGGAGAVGGGPSGTTCGQAGGAGSGRTNLIGTGGTSGCGGGGGAGGGAGYIHVHGATLDIGTSATVSPNAIHD